MDIAQIFRGRSGVQYPDEATTSLLGRKVWLQHHILFPPEAPKSQGISTEEAVVRVYLSFQGPELSFRQISIKYHAILIELEVSVQFLQQFPDLTMRIRVTRIGSSERQTFGQIASNMPITSLLDPTLSQLECHLCPMSCRINIILLVVLPRNYKGQYQPPVKGNSENKT